ncbi:MULTISPECIES: gliding motility protein GldN [unclassified Mucilaginibacter]|uniref:type IX secretion system ring protein PorN/GldN n=1 Tax=unclassified Mucilaginibacter TaxID=2617802 RepID=UPI000967355F|nr:MULTISPECIES: gliding motility protein GldN [unclassified Mucilaginibacter]OJW14482.1 MAG: gliding motility protein GldN [Mucilaginibacter sp. 44-25]PLW90924.1 MAG: gliding motility protein GldN [Mucilaginibacter sp.]HEK22001.1 gliding motility protein GldN [Bacteroidota bacterium]
MKKSYLIILLCLACSVTFAQRKRTTKRAAKPAAVKAAPNSGVSQAGATTSAAVQPDTSRKAFDRPLDGYYKKNNILSARVTPYANLREADVMFARRIWREIDLREKMNQYLASPKQRLIDVLMAAIADGELTAYDPTPSKDDPNGDSFSKPLSAAQAQSRMADSAVVDKFDKDGNKIGSEVRAGEFNPDSVIKFRIKEDWVFDKQRSIFEPRIIGIAPLIKPKAAGLDLEYQPAFWIYFPKARPILATKEAVSRNNDATGLSFDDCFVKRIFTSYIVKQSNDKDERIRDYMQGIDKLYESDRIKKTLLDYELNLWRYGE